MISLSIIIISSLLLSLSMNNLTVHDQLPISFSCSVLSQDKVLWLEIGNICQNYLFEMFVRNICQKYLLEMFVRNICQKYLSEIIDSFICQQIVKNYCQNYLLKNYEPSSSLEMSVRKIMRIHQHVRKD